MTTPTLACPYCRSGNIRLVADHLGKVAWCRDCHRAWEPSTRVAGGRAASGALERPLSPRRASAGATAAAG